PPRHREPHGPTAPGHRGRDPPMRISAEHEESAHALLAPTLLGMIDAVKEASARLASRGQPRRAVDGEAVHDFRVALRRLRTLLRPARRVYGKKRLRAVAAELRRFAQATGEIGRAHV